MLLLPYERFVIRTRLDPNTVLSRIDGIMERSIGWFGLLYANEGKPYHGKLEDNRFELNRNIHFRNSFLPVIKGRVNPDVQGSIILVAMRLNFCVMIFLTIWFGGLFYGLCSGLMEIIQAGTFAITGYAFLPLGLLLFGYLLTMICFKIEAFRSTNFLSDLLEAQQLIDLGPLETEMNT
jgi:hypothetical protein